MEYRMQSFIFPRCLPILYDSSINTFDTIVTNFYQMMLFAACKTAEYLRDHAALVQSSTLHNIDYILHCMRHLPLFAIRNIKSKSKCFCNGENDSKKMIGVEICLASFLSWRAFYDVFSYLSDFSAISNRILEEASTSLANVRHNIQQGIHVTMSRALDDFQIRHMIQR